MKDKTLILINGYDVCEEEEVVMKLVVMRVVVRMVLRGVLREVVE